jgi:hypothetical protein
MTAVLSNSDVALTVQTPWHYHAIGRPRARRRCRPATANGRRQAIKPSAAGLNSNDPKSGTGLIDDVVWPDSPTLIDLLSRDLSSQTSSRGHPL